MKERRRRQRKRERKKERTKECCRGKARQGRQGKGEGVRRGWWAACATDAKRTHIHMRACVSPACARANGQGRVQ